MDLKVSSVIVTPSYNSDVHEVVGVAKSYREGLVVEGLNMTDSELEDVLVYVENHPVNERAWRLIELEKYDSKDDENKRIDLWGIEKHDYYKTIDHPANWLYDCPHIDMILPNHSLIRGLTLGLVSGENLIRYNESTKKYVYKFTDDTERDLDATEYLDSIINSSFFKAGSDEFMVCISEHSCVARLVSPKNMILRHPRALEIEAGYFGKKLELEDF